MANNVTIFQVCQAPFWWIDACFVTQLNAYLFFFDNAPASAIFASSQTGSELVTQLKTLKQSYFDRKPSLSAHENLSEKDRTALLRNIKKTNQEQKIAFQNIQQELEEHCLEVMLSIVVRFLLLHEQCESPLEKAFLTGLVAHETSSSNVWLDPEIFHCQLKVSNYRLDFAIKDLQNNVKVAIELDGHTYHERTEDQAVSDRKRDRILQQHGWQVIRFHRKEIEDDLKSCIRQASQTWSQHLELREK